MELDEELTLPISAGVDILTHRISLARLQHVSNLAWCLGSWLPHLVSLSVLLIRLVSQQLHNACVVFLDILMYLSPPPFDQLLLIQVLKYTIFCIGGAGAQQEWKSGGRGRRRSTFSSSAHPKTLCPWCIRRRRIGLC